MERGTRRGRPAVEALEGRQLLSAVVAEATTIPPARAIDKAHGIPGQDRLFQYTTPNGAHVSITLYGIGSLAGTADNGGVLNLVYSGTNDQTLIFGQVHGGNGHALLGSVLPANVPAQTLSGVGASPLAELRLKDFDLEAGGQINLTAGVHTLQLDAIGPDTQVNLRELPQALTAAGGSVTASGQTLSYSTGADGSQTLTSVTGQFTPAKNLPLDHTLPSGLPVIGAPPAPPGILALVNHVNGPARASSDLPDANLFAFDPVQNALVRFDVTTNQGTGAATGTPDLTIPSPFPAGATVAGVALARDNGTLVALVGSGTTVAAFNATTGAPAGTFSTAGLAAAGFQTVSGIGSTDSQTVLEDATAGVFQTINVTASLASGQAVPVGAVFSPDREFAFSGGLTGVPGSNLLYASGAAHFDTFQPNLLQLGVLTLNATGNSLSEAARNPLKSNGNFIDVGSPQSTPTNALGALDQNLALLTGAANGVNTVALYSQSLSPAGTLTLNDHNLLTDLSETFRPGLAGLAVFDVQGNVQSFRAHDTTGLVLNDLGNLNLAKIGTATDTTIVGEPFSHAAIRHRQNVTILTTSRLVGDRNGVVIESNLRPVGPLSQP